MRKVIFVAVLFLAVPALAAPRQSPLRAKLDQCEQPITERLNGLQLQGSGQNGSPPEVTMSEQCQQMEKLWARGRKGQRKAEAPLPARKVA